MPVLAGIDVFWVFGSKSVFGSNVMVTVAKGAELEIQIIAMSLKVNPTEGTHDSGLIHTSLMF